MSVRRLNEPVPVQVRAADAPAGAGVGVRPAQLFNSRARRWVPIEHILDSWVVDDRWWNEDAVRRAYFSCQTTDGTVTTLFLDLERGSWHAQR